jgi:hypothetical protein
VAVVENYAYLADGGDGLRIIDVADPAHPAESGSYATPGYAQDVALAGNYAYLADEIGLRIIDVSDPATPGETGSCETPGNAQGVALAGNYTYVADENSLRIIDVADPNHPTEAGFTDTSLRLIWDVAGRQLRLRHR